MGHKRGNSLEIPFQTGDTSNVSRPRKGVKEHRFADLWMAFSRDEAD
jgi:hypothetical protein